MSFSASPTYAELKTEVQDWLDRDDAVTVAKIPSFCRYAHDEVVRELRLPLIRKVAPLILAGERVSLPADFQALSALTIGDTLGAEFGSTSPSLRAAHAARWPSGRPREYSIEAGDLAFAPVPDASYTASLIYDATPALMVADGDSNPIFAKTPYLYLQGALAAGFLFNQFSQQAALYEGQFRSTLAGVMQRGVADAYGGSLQIRPSPGFCP